MSILEQGKEIIQLEDQLVINKQKINISEVVIDGTFEQGIEADIILPDYCAEIVKLIKCIGKPIITSYDVMGDKLNIEGTVFITIYYNGDGKQIRCYEQKQGFRKVIEIKNITENMHINIIPIMDYINCRVASKRRVDIRGAVSIKVQILGSKEYEIISDIEGMGTQLKERLEEVTRLSEGFEKSFSIKEDIELGSGKPPIGWILRSNARAGVSDYKVIPGKVVLKGNMWISLLYQPEDENQGTQKMEYTIPINQIIDVETVGDGSICDIRLRVTSLEILNKESDDDNGLVVTATICVEIKSYETEQIGIIEDSYSTIYEINNESKQIVLSRIDSEQIVNETYQYKESVSLPDAQIAQGQILDMWFDILSSEGKISDGKMTITGKMLLSMFALDSDDNPVYFDKELEVVFSKEVTGATSITAPQMQAMSLSYTLLEGSQVDIRCEIGLRAIVMQSSKCTALSEVTVDKGAVKAKKRQPLILYYADKGELVWDIAKSYSCDCRSMKSENDIMGDEIGERSILVLSCV